MSPARRVGLALALGHLLLALAVTGVDWVPHDEGLLGQTAERVLRGERPHVDFQDTYTGGLAWWHALAFRWMGVGSASMRLALLPAYLGFVLAAYAILWRRWPPVVAAAVVTAAGLLTLPNYAAPMPSWYNLFLSVIGTWALLRAIEGGKRRWAVLAGLCGGLSFLCKITALYWVGAAGVVLLPRRARVPAAVVLVAGALAVGLDGRQALASAWQLALPIAASGLAVGAWGRWPGRGAPAFALGFALPVALFVVPYARDGQLGALVTGLFVTPWKRLDGVVAPLPPPWTAVLALPFALAWWRRADRAWWLLALLVAGALVASAWLEPYRAVFMALRQVFPVLGLAGAVALRRAGEPATALVVLGALLTSLVQVPYAGPLYFLHAAPFAVIAWAWVARDLGGVRLHAVLLAFLLGYAGLWMAPRPLDRLRGIDRPGPYVTLGLARSDLRVSEWEAKLYRAVVTAVRAHADAGDAVLALPDCPEINFLSATRNPTPWLYQLFAPRDDLRFDRVARLAVEADVRVLVVNEEPNFSPPMSAAYRERLEGLFPEGGRLVVDGEPARFTVRWR